MSACCTEPQIFWGFQNTLYTCMSVFGIAFLLLQFPNVLSRSCRMPHPSSGDTSEQEEVIQIHWPSLISLAPPTCGLSCCKSAAARWCRLTNCKAVSVPPMPRAFWLVEHVQHLSCFLNPQHLQLRPRTKTVSHILPYPTILCHCKGMEDSGHR